MGYVNAQADSVYLEQLMEGAPIAKPNELGVLELTTLENYKAGLPNFDLMDVSQCWSRWMAWMARQYWPCCNHVWRSLQGSWQPLASPGFGHQCCKLQCLEHRYMPVVHSRPSRLRRASIRHQVRSSSHCCRLPSPLHHRHW